VICWGLGSHRVDQDGVAAWSLRTPLERLSGARLAWSAIGVQATDYEVVLLLRGAAPVPLVVEDRSPQAWRRVEITL
jgi:hypothetical protein